MDKIQRSAEQLSSLLRAEGVGRVAAEGGQVGSFRVTVFDRDARHIRINLSRGNTPPVAHSRDTLPALRAVEGAKLQV